ncbi:MAG: precorrin-6y C5,15-methyltransferase (decarboxylating) subunit CbiE [Alistipes sp.]|nr:precorrin-6y C5,15-methyltransferase (decarboxylating) subunit CbiE [Alistipes sp.]
MQQQFTVIGMDDSAAPRFSEEILTLIARSRIFSGGRRHRDLVAPLLPPEALWIDITVPLDEVFRAYAPHPKIVVFASGDPLFFGFAATLRRRLPEARIAVYPAFNSLQILAHRIVMPYERMRIVSLTGRPWHEFDRALIEGCPQIGVLTDRTHTPAAIARRMLDYGYGDYTMHVGERLGGACERIRRLSAEEAARGEFASPNCLILEGAGRKRPFGIPDGRFELLDGRARMITKMPVRLTALSLLDLNRRRVFWDVGFCTGSVSIEARLQFPHLLVHSFEIRPEGERLMQTNSRRFGAPGIETHIGDFLTADLGGMPAPDAVFIGGHGGRLDEMLQRIARVLAPDGAVVFNSVSEESLALFERSAEAAGMEITGRIALQVDRHNKIEILRAEPAREAGDGGPEPR